MEDDTFRVMQVLDERIDKLTRNQSLILEALTKILTKLE